MSAVAARKDIWLAGISAGCERLVHPGVEGACERQRQQRFVGVALAAPFIGAAALAQALHGFFTAAALLAIVCGTFALAWTLGSIVVVSGKRTLAEPASLALAAVAVAIVLAAGGGAGQPVALLAVALVFEAWWVDRGVKGVVAGVVAAAVSFPLSIILGHYLGAASTGMTAWGWLAPAIYVATVAPRAADALKAAQAGPAQPSLDQIADLFGMAAVRLTVSGEIAEASDEAARLLGQPAALLAGRSLFERVHVADRVAFINVLVAINDSGGRQSIELRIRSAGQGAGSERFLSAIFDLVRDEGAPEQFTVLIRDNSAVAAMRDEMQSARDVADSTEIAKSRFLAAVSHELRTPLNAIIGFSDMMLHDMAGPMAEQQHEYVGLIRDSGDHLLSVVNAILDVSKIESGAYSIRAEPFMVHEAVDLCQSMMAHQAETQGIALTVSVRPEVREMTADRRAVQQIVINLLSNAIKFTPSGGEVSLDVFRKGPKLHFVVADTGIGIAEGDLGRLGQPFTQVKNDITRQFEGTGLGLSLVKGLVALHEGTMAIESAPGEGTTVIVALPADGPKAAIVGSRTDTPVTATVHEIDKRVRHETVRKTA